MVPFFFPDLDNNTYTKFQKTLPQGILATSLLNSIFKIVRQTLKGRNLFLTRKATP